MVKHALHIKKNSVIFECCDCVFVMIELRSIFITCGSMLMDEECLSLFPSKHSF